MRSLLIACLFALGTARCSCAGDAVVVGYNAGGTWTSVTYYCSGTPDGGKDYKTSTDATAAALRDLDKRSKIPFARTDVLAASDATGFAGVARGRKRSGKQINVADYGKTQAEADEHALEKLTKAGATEKQKIVYRYFSYGVDSSGR